MKKGIITVSVAIVSVISISVGIFVFINAENNSGTSNNQQTKQVDDQKISVSGTLECLKHKDSNRPQTMECAFGLVTNDNKSYGLGSEDPMLIGTIPTNSQIEVNGTLKSETGQNKYETEGTIWVDSVKRL